MKLKTAVFAALLFLGSVGTGAAQTALGTFTKGGSSTSATGAVTSAIVAGWNYYHPVACTYYPGTLAMVTNDNSIWYITDVGAATTLAPACQSGNWVAFYVSGNVWTQVFVWPTK